MRGFVFLLLVLGGNVTASDREAVLSRLQGYEWRLEEAGFDTLGPTTAGTLLEIAGDAEVSAVVQERAIAALTMFPQDRVFDFYVEAMAMSPNMPRKRRVIDSICTAFLGSRPADVEALFIPLLKSDDVLLRTRAARCIRDSGNEATREALHAYYGSIELSWEKEAAGYLPQ